MVRIGNYFVLFTVTAPGVYQMNAYEITDDHAEKILEPLPDKSGKNISYTKLRNSICNRIYPGLLQMVLMVFTDKLILKCQN